MSATIGKHSRIISTTIADEVERRRTKRFKVEHCPTELDETDETDETDADATSERAESKSILVSSPSTHDEQVEVLNATSEFIASDACEGRISVSPPSSSSSSLTLLTSTVAAASRHRCADGGDDASTVQDDEDRVRGPLAFQAHYEWSQPHARNMEHECTYPGTVAEISEWMSLLYANCTNDDTATSTDPGGCPHVPRALAKLVQDYARLSQPFLGIAAVSLHPADRERDKTLAADCNVDIIDQLLVAQLGLAKSWAETLAATSLFCRVQYLPHGEYLISASADFGIDYQPLMEHLTSLYIFNVHTGRIRELTLPKLKDLLLSTRLVFMTPLSKHMDMLSLPSGQATVLPSDVHGHTSQIATYLHSLVGYVDEQPKPRHLWAISPSKKMNISDEATAYTYLLGLDSHIYSLTRLYQADSRCVRSLYRDVDIAYDFSAPLAGGVVMIAKKHAHSSVLHFYDSMTDYYRRVPAREKRLQEEIAVGDDISGVIPVSETRCWIITRACAIYEYDLFHDVFHVVGAKAHGADTLLRPMHSAHLVDDGFGMATLYVACSTNNQFFIRRFTRQTCANANDDHVGSDFWKQHALYRMQPGSFIEWDTA